MYDILVQSTIEKFKLVCKYTRLIEYYYKIEKVCIMVVKPQYLRTKTTQIKRK